MGEYQCLFDLFIQLVLMSFTLRHVEIFGQIKMDGNQQNNLTVPVMSITITVTMTVKIIVLSNLFCNNTEVFVCLDETTAKSLHFLLTPFI